jgi:biotin-dependent carboxylase-like uncharacterized protein
MNPSQGTSNHDAPSGIEVFLVQEAGVMTTVQDVRRFSYRWMGMPVSGTLDPYAYRIGNLLLLQDENLACLETTYMGPRLEVLSDIRIAVTGADVIPKRNGKPFPMWTAVNLLPGDDVSFGPARSGCRAYLCVMGGIDVPEIMGSRSTNVRLKLGGLEGRTLRSGDRIIALSPGDGQYKTQDRSLPADLIPDYPSSVEARVVLGPQREYFDRRGMGTFLGSSYQVTPEANREGIRLEGPSVDIKKGRKKSIPSEACPPGGVQIRPNGKPIILLNDLGGGGYAKIATVLSCDLPKVAQLKPGDEVTFRSIVFQEAHRILREEEERLKKFKAGLRP